MAANKTNWKSCNLIEPSSAGSRLWQFSVSSKKVKLGGDLSVPEGENPPAKVVTKPWTDMFSRKMNIASLPPEKVFLRAVDLPACEPEELLPMLEFQVEELSPLPMTQAVWSAEPVPGPANEEGTQTVLVMITSRDAVEERLTELEGEGYLADRVESPLLRELLAEGTREDGAHIQLVQGADSVFALVSWWFDGRLRDVNSFNLPDHEESRGALVEKLNRVAWAGEVAGWMPSEVTCHLAKRGEVTADWKPALAKCFGDRIREVEPMSEVDLATATAEYATQSNAPGLMLDDYGMRYRQRFQDGLWMEGIKGAVAMMLLGLLAYFGYANYLKGQLSDMEQQVKTKGLQYTNALAAKARVETLEKRKALKYAALEAWKQVTVALPPELSFIDLDFSSEGIGGKTSRKLKISGSGEAGANSLLYSYQERLTRMETGDGASLFSDVKFGGTRADTRNKNQFLWSLTCSFDGE